VVGTNADATHPLPADGSIQIAFDRYLHPASVVRQSFVIVGGPSALAPVVTYDPVARVVVLAQPAGGAWLVEGQPYRVVMPLPTEAEPFGPRAIDGATLDPGGTNEVAFIAAAPGGPQPADRAVEFCADVLPLFQEHCSASSCHGTPRDVGATSRRFPDGLSRPASGLILQTPIGVVKTAINRAAQGANTGPRSGRGSAPGRVFGIDMPIIDVDNALGVGNPANSWLMYKVLLGTLRPEDVDTQKTASKCGPDAPDPAPVIDYPFAQPVSDEERARLANFILGKEMPYPSGTPEGEPTDNPPLTFDELERVRAWIAAGAQTQDCPACPE
jgi:hypothetical protein